MECDPYNWLYDVSSVSHRRGLVGSILLLYIPISRLPATWRLINHKGVAYRLVYFIHQVTIFHCYHHALHSALCLDVHCVSPLLMVLHQTLGHVLLHSTIAFFTPLNSILCAPAWVGPFPSSSYNIWLPVLVALKKLSMDLMPGCWRVETVFVGLVKKSRNILNSSVIWEVRWHTINPFIMFTWCLKYELQRVFRFKGRYSIHFQLSSAQC